MIKYLVGLGALVVVVIGYFLLAPGAPAPSPAPDVATPAPAVAPESPPAVVAPAAPVASVPDVAAPATLNEEAMLEEIAANAREGLPSTVTDTLMQTDALFLPRMRIMEYTYVSAAADARAASANMRALIEASAERICIEGREMFKMDVTLRNSFEDRDGTLFQRVYILPEDCQQFY